MLSVRDHQRRQGCFRLRGWRSQNEESLDAREHAPRWWVDVHFGLAKSDGLSRLQYPVRAANASLTFVVEMPTSLAIAGSSFFHAVGGEGRSFGSGCRVLWWNVSTIAWRTAAGSRSPGSIYFDFTGLGLWAIVPYHQLELAWFGFSFVGVLASKQSERMVVSDGSSGRWCRRMRFYSRDKIPR